MFGELPKLLDRNFAIGYFLPVVAFMAASASLLSQYNINPGLPAQLQGDLLVGITVISLVSWLASIGLLAFNRWLIRLAEGYGKYNPLKLFAFIEKRRYEGFKKEIASLDAIYDACLDNGKEFPLELRMKRNRLMRELVEHFPDQPEWVMSTTFGNTIRAFEVYPRVIYGIEGVQGWTRLLAVLPKDFRDLLDSAKAHVDFWINMGFLSLVLLTEYLGFSIYSGQLRAFEWPLIALALTILATTQAIHAAVEWGELVKSAFDVFLPKLYKELELPDQALDDRRHKWIKFSQAVIFRLPKIMAELHSGETGDQKSDKPSG